MGTLSCEQIQGLENRTKKKPLKNQKAKLRKLDYDAVVMASQSLSVLLEESQLDLFHWNMALSVPYHPYNCCLICGSNFAAPQQQIEVNKGQEWIVEWWPEQGPLAVAQQNNSAEKEEKQTKNRRKLLRCSGCKQATYCSQRCQKLDWNVNYCSNKGIEGATCFFHPFRFIDESVICFKMRTKWRLPCQKLSRNLPQPVTDAFYETF